MGLESVTYISDLVVGWPLGSDKIRQGDDHIRNIKKSLHNTFPNIDGAVTATQEALNSLPANFAAVLAELLEHIVPIGAIFAWSGSIGTIPVGYSLCDGTNGTPNLRDRFIVGAGSTYAVGNAGGAVAGTTSSNGGHDHAGATGIVALTEAMMPAHNHRLWVSNSTDSSDANAFGIGSSQAVAGNSDSTRAYRDANGLSEQLVENTGSGAAHSHTIGTDGGHTHTVATLPPYYALAYIMKTTTYVAP